MKTSLDVTKEAGYFFFVLSGALFVALIIGNGGAYAQMFRYLLISASPAGTLTSPVLTEEAEISNTISALESAKPLVSPKYIAAAMPQNTYSLSIPRIGITTAMTIPKSTARQDVLASLKKGVGLYPASSLPGYPGRAIILGHSSRPYAFTLLETARVGDRVTITAGSKEYIYEVFERSILSPQATDAILNGPLGAESELALITCWPTGNSAKRVLVRARLISPNALTNL